MQAPRAHRPRIRPSIPHLLALALPQEIKLSDTDRTMISAAACEPEPRPGEPAAEGKHSDYAHRYGGVVKGLPGDGVDCWQAEDDGDECDLFVNSNASVHSSLDDV